eukprot:CAMPEP_0113728100 /NCGR_PEP_ID=MMETSP0038_2-20120614/41654_1 /TAXON_ID=2898 /ORGANISM="Cryptomonas paramecium" /LENGTH=312 /DNA_ID=CAMNT_0000659489 /DNA_START=22 /DNA_END=960 /DNA_ORIENTATION=- /assembly_acc=CAM_ASM_000170
MIRSLRFRFAMPSVARFSTAAGKSTGFIGLGNMGASMAINLVKSGRKVVVYDINQAALAKLKDAGASVASTPAEVAAQSEVVITMLPASPHVLDVFRNPKTGILSTANKGALMIDCSTIDPQSARAVGEDCRNKGLVFCDAPVSGGTAGAAAGTLTFMVGAEDAASMAKTEAVLVPAAGKKAIHCGGKLCNNLLLGISMAGLAEAMRLGEKLGVDPKVLGGVINSSSGKCWSSEVYNPCPGVLENVPAGRGYSGGFATDLMLKDLSLATAAARDAKTPLPLGGLAQQLYALNSAQGNGSLDFSAIYQLFKGK